MPLWENFIFSQIILHDYAAAFFELICGFIHLQLFIHLMMIFFGGGGDLEEGL